MLSLLKCIADHLFIGLMRRFVSFTWFFILRVYWQVHTNLGKVHKVVTNEEWRTYIVDLAFYTVGY